ncbi:VOC family protein [Undibacterium sp. TJN25]|uniref:VOC family protein n=1 Tax=Undibacterium sp. TJN25 TaxID=3413056 RepID=UPI003BF45772
MATSAPSITPGLLYHDAGTAIEWLCRVLGFEQKLVVPGENGLIAHAHLTFGNGGIMLSSAEAYPFPQMCRSPRQAGGVGTSEIIVYVEQVDAHYANAVQNGAEVLIALEDKPYGGRGYCCRDPEGYVWAFGSYDAWA